MTTTLSSAFFVIIFLATCCLAQLFTPDCRAVLLGAEGTPLTQSLNAFSLPVAIIHSSELTEQKTENNQRVYRYLLTDIGGSL